VFGALTPNETVHRSLLPEDLSVVHTFLGSIIVADSFDMLLFVLRPIAGDPITKNGDNRAMRESTSSRLPQRMVGCSKRKELQERHYVYLPTTAKHGVLLTRHSYKKAYESMKACPLTFSHPSEAQQLHGLGPKLCERLTEELTKHCAANGLPLPKKCNRCCDTVLALG